MGSYDVSFGLRLGNIRIVMYFFLCNIIHFRVRTRGNCRTSLEPNYLPDATHDLKSSIDIFQKATVRSSSKFSISNASDEVGYPRTLGSPRHPAIACPLQSVVFDRHLSR